MGGGGLRSHYLDWAEGFWVPTVTQLRSYGLNFDFSRLLPALNFLNPASDFL